MPDNTSQAFLRELDKKLWTAADRLRSNLDAAVYKHAVLGLIFLKYVSDSLAQRQAEIEGMLKDPKIDSFLNPADYPKQSAYADALQTELEERDYYLEKNVFWVPELARWNTLQDSADRNCCCLYTADRATGAADHHKCSPISNPRRAA